MKTNPPRIITFICLLTTAIGCGQGNSDEYKPFSKIDANPDKQITISKQSDPVTPKNDLPQPSETIAQDPGSEQPAFSSEKATDTTMVKTEVEQQGYVFEPVVAQKPLVKAARKLKLLIPEKTFRTEGPEKAYRVTYDDINLLKVLNAEPVKSDAIEQMPGWLKDLDGKRIRIRGFMSPAFEPTGLRAFLMGRDNQACCFPGRAKVYDLFFVRMRNGETTDFIDNRPFDVVGIFHITPRIEEDGKVSELYQIDDAMVIEK